MFALFHYNADGDHTSRYSLYKRNYTHSCVIIERVACSQLFLEEGNYEHATPVPTLVKIQRRSGRGELMTVWWETTWKVIFNGQDVPVLDFLNKEFFSSEPTITVVNDRASWCDLRRQEQLNLFDEMTTRIASQIPDKFPEWILTQIDNTPPELNESTSSIIEAEPIQIVRAQPKLPTNIKLKGTKCVPGFIAEALVIKGITKGESCPISMNLYNECHKVTVTNCYHCFDDESLSTWLNTKKECPVCKTVLHSFVSMDVHG